MRLISYFIFICICIISNISLAAEEIAIEAQSRALDDAVIFHYPKKLKLQIEYKGSNILIKSDKAMKFKIHPKSNRYLLEDVKSLKSKLVSIKLRKNYTSHSIVAGEKFTALKLIDAQKMQKQLNKAALESTPNQSLPEEKTKDAQQSLETGPFTKALVKKNKDMIEIKFPFNVDLAAAAFQRNNKLIIGFNKKEDIIFPDSKLLTTKPSIRYHDDATIISIKIEKTQAPELIKLNNTWILRIYTKTNPSNKKHYQIQKSVQGNQIMVHGDSFKSLIRFRDEEVGDTITMVTDSNGSKSVDITRYFNDLTIPKTLSGAVIVWLAEDLSAKIVDAGVEIECENHQMPQEEVVARSESPKPRALKSYLPLNKYKDPHLDFVSTRIELYKKLASSDKSNELENAAELSYFFFSYGMYQEAIGAINFLDYTEEFLAKNPEFPFYKAVLYSLMSRYKEANEILHPMLKMNIPEQLKQEVSMWSKHNDFYLHNNPEHIDVLKFMDSVLAEYPDEYYWKMIFAELEIISITNDLSVSDTLLNNLRRTSDRITQDKLNYFKAVFFKKAKRYNQAMNYYNVIMLDPKMPRTYVQSQFDKIDMLIRNNRIDIADAVNELQNLTFLWRGDILEYNILFKMAELLQTSKEYLRALRVYKYILDAFPDSSSRVYISKQMVEIYNNQIFSEYGLHRDMPDFQLVSLYYEFRELTPIGDDGDKITLVVASRLIKLDLLDQAEKILDHQIKYRLEGGDKILAGDHLAAIYILNHKAQLALDVLNETDAYNFGFLEHITRVRMKAKAMIDMQDYAGAVETLKYDDSQSAKAIKEEAYFQMRNWENFILLAESSLLPILESDKTISENYEKEVLRLAIAYSQSGKLEELQSINKQLKTDNQLLRDTINLLIASSNSINIYEIDSRFKVNEVERYFNAVVSKLFNF